MDNKILPAHVLRLYVWALLEAEGVLTKIGDLIPIAPIEDEPKFVASGQAYIVYGYTEMPGTELDQNRRGNFSMRVSAPSFGQLGHVLNTIARAFESCDVSVPNVNAWSSDYQTGLLVGIRFTDIEMTYLEGGEPPNSEGGPTEGVINLGYEYITQQRTKVYRPAGTRIRNSNGTYTTTTQDEWV